MSRTKAAKRRVAEQVLGPPQNITIHVGPSFYTVSCNMCVGPLWAYREHTLGPIQDSWREHLRKAHGANV